MWAELHTIVEIAEALDISEDTVRAYVRRARRLNDPRASRPHNWNRRQECAARRKTQITLMAKAGVSITDIARKMGISVRLVRMRIKEASDG